MKKSISNYLSSIGKKGGKAKSDAKARAVRENGKKGGRPKKEMSYAHQLPPAEIKRTPPQCGKTIL